MGGKLKKLMEHRDTILLAEVGALIHDLGKLNVLFMERQAKENEGKIDYRHGDIIDVDSERDDKVGELAKKLRGILEKCKLLDSNLYEVIKAHHSKDEREKLPLLLKFVIASDEFDSEEDRGKAKDKQFIYKTFKSFALGYESEINLNELERFRREIYEELIDVLNTCDISKILEKRRELSSIIKDYFSKSLGMTARAANDVTLWDHSYMTATIMKALMAYRVLDSNFVVESKQKIMEKKPFQVFAVGWNFFGFIEQSHKIPDTTGRIETIKEIKEEIKHIVEERYLLGNSIYDDDFGIYFLIPSILDENDLGRVKKEIFGTFNDKTNGILLPVFHLEKPDLNVEFRIGKLLTKAMKEVKKKIISHKVELAGTPAWIDEWKNTEHASLPMDKLVCNVCGKGFYCTGDDEKICETCKDIRMKGRKSKPPQTAFIDEIAWNPEKRRYENVCLLIAKFNLDEWLDGRFVQGLFIRNPDLTAIKWLHDFYNSKLCIDFKLNENLIKNNLLSLGALLGYVRNPQARNVKERAVKQVEDAIQYYKSLDEFSKRELKHIKESLEKAKNFVVDDNIDELKKLLPELDLNRLINDLKDKIIKFEENVVTFEEKISKFERSFIKDAKDIKEVLQKMFQKPPSPSRLMRVWRDTASFFNMIAKKIEEKAPDVAACNVEVNEFTLKGKKLVEGLAYIVKIPKLGISGEAVCEENCETPIYLRIVTPHLSESLTNNKSKVLGTGIEIYHPERKDLIAVATIGGIVPVESDKAYRTISISPTLFMAIIPAKDSIKVIEMIKDEYEKHFGKVFGKLPLHVGLIYFKRKMPIFAVLDSANRMLNGFEELSKSDLNNYIKLRVVSDPTDENDCKVLELSPVGEERKSLKYKTKIPYKLGDGNPDYYHPYLIVESSDDVIEAKINEDTIITQKHISKIKKEDIVKVRKYFLDFVFLDSNIRRFDIGKERKHWLFTNSTNKPKPYLLWDIENFERLRELIIEKLELTTTQVMNLYEMLMSKIDEWNLKDVDRLKKDEAFEKFVDNAIKSIPLRLKVVDNGKSEKGKIAKKDYEFFRDSILNGMFFDFVDLWHTILKFEFKRGGERNV